MAEHQLAVARALVHTDPQHQHVFQQAQTTHDAAVAHVKQAVKTARDCNLARDIATVTQAYKTRDSKVMWKNLKRVGGCNVHTPGRGAGPQMLKGSDGNLVMASQQIADILATQYESTTTAHTFAQGASFDENHKLQVENAVASFRATTDIGPQQLGANIELAEVQLQCKL